jgi:4,5-DOPA dioxygenase extradiol
MPEIMKRRTFAALAGGVSTLIGPVMTQIAEAAGLAMLESLPSTPRMPVLFLGHGSPMNAIEDNEFHRSWQALGSQFGTKWPKPKLILCISAHWITRGWWLTAMANPKTIHDFGGFPQALFDQQYPAPGAPDAARAISHAVQQPDSHKPLALDAQEWGLDHGTWAVLKPMFPQADIPIIQLSMDYGRPPAEHFALGRQLRALRERGVLIVGSGNIVHNLRTMQRAARADQAYDWAIEFDRVTAEHIAQGRLDALADFQSLGQVAQMAHPTYDHYLPLLYAAGAVQDGEAPQFFNAKFQGASISMRSVIWG